MTPLEVLGPFFTLIGFAITLVIVAFAKSRKNPLSEYDRKIATFRKRYKHLFKESNYGYSSITPLVYLPTRRSITWGGDDTLEVILFSDEDERKEVVRFWELMLAKQTAKRPLDEAANLRHEFIKGKRRYADRD